MKKIAFIVLFLLTVLNLNASALDFKIFEMRNKLFETSQEIKKLMPQSNDSVLLISMFDSCILTMTQIDAYYSMLGIFDRVRKEDLNNTTLDFMIGWLTETRKTNEINIKNLSSISSPIEKSTKMYSDKLRSDFNDLNKILDNELNKLSIIKKSLKVKPKR